MEYLEVLIVALGKEEYSGLTGGSCHGANCTYVLTTRRSFARPVEFTILAWRTLLCVPRVNYSSP